MAFPPKVVERLLVACHRHCCICHKPAGSKMEIHHIVPKSEGGEDTEENGIPLCFDCHAEVGAYNLKHPKGRRFTSSELKKHKEQWFAICAARGPAQIAALERIEPLLERALSTPIPTQEPTHRISYTPPSPPASDILPKPGPLPPGSRLPFHRNALFTGRVEPLKSLARALLHDGAGSTLVTQAVHGMGGIGKTQLAVEFAWRYGQFFHGVHWIDAAQPETIAAGVTLCGEAMDLPNWPTEQPDQVACTIREWQQGDLRLVILDNLEDLDAAREWLRQLSGGSLRLLLTARRSDWPVHLGLSLLSLDLFTPAESHTFLRRYLSKRRATDADLKALAKRLGHLPLALELAGRYLKHHRRLAVTDYLGKWEAILSHRSMRNWRAREGSPTGHDLDLARTFFVSWERVEDETTRRLFLLAGYCAPNQPIPCELLEQAAGLDEESCDESLDVLTGLGLLEMETTPDTSHPAPTIHPLLAEYARHQETEPAPLPALASALARLAKQANEQMDQTGSPSHFLPLLHHVRLVARTAEGEQVEDAASLSDSLGYYLNRVADHAGARSAYERALAMDEAVYGRDHPRVAIDVNNLGGVLKYLGKLGEARAAFERALAIDEAVYGRDHPRVAIDVNNLGLVLKDLGELGEARAACKRALAIDEAVYGLVHPSVARDVNNLGGVLRDLGELGEARSAYERALAIFERVFGTEHPNMATLVNNLGVVLQDLGELGEARAAYRRALAMDEAVYGRDHPRVAIDINNLAMVLRDLGEPGEARVALERALAIFEKFLPPDHPRIRIVRDNLESL
jgi:tetratricopeptide (TPR) repeat protein